MKDYKRKGLVLVILVISISGLLFYIVSKDSLTNDFNNDEIVGETSENSGSVSQEHLKVII